MKEEKRQKSSPGAILGTKLDDQVPDDAIPFGDGRHLYSPSQKALINAEACAVAQLVQEED